MDLQNSAACRQGEVEPDSDLSIPPFLDRRTDAPVTRDGALIPAQVLTLTRRIKALIEKGDRAADKAEQFYKAAGIHIKEIKQQHSEHWETIVQDKCGLGRSRAYELIAIADGRTSLERLRAKTNERKKVHRAKPESVPERTEPKPVKQRANGSADTEFTEEQHRARMAALDQPAEAVDEVNKRVNCAASAIRRQVAGLSSSDAERFFTTLRDCVDVIELALRAGVIGAAS